MVRTSQGLFVPTIESLFLSLVAYFALSASMDQFMATDFSPAMRSVLFSQVVLTILHAFSQLIISAMDKMVFVTADVAWLHFSQRTTANNGSEEEPAVDITAANISHNPARKGATKEPAA